MPIVIKTTYTKDLLLRFNFYIFKSKRVLNTLYFILGIFNLAVLIIFAILNILTTESILVFSIIIFYVALYFLLPLIVAPITLRKATNLNTELTYSFEEDQLKIIALNSMTNENSIVNYSIFKKVVKHKNNIYLFFERYQAFIVDISNTDTESLSSLKAILREKIPQKKFKWK